MRFHRTPARSLYSLLLWAGLCSAQTLSPAQAPELVDRYREQLEQQEQTVGRYDPSLLESLERLAQVTVELDQFAETDAILDRAIQILRINEGLYTDSQFPFLVLSVRNNVRRGNWSDANETLNHLTWLYTAVPRRWNSELVDELKQLSDLHLEGVAADAERMKDAHFRAADRINWVAIQVGELIWPANDSRLVELYYHQVIQNHLKLIALNQGGEASADLRQVVSGAGWMRPRQAVQGMYYRLGLEMLRRIRQVYAGMEPPNLEAMAMVSLYEADWQVIFDEGDPGDAYRQAYRNLLESGVDEGALEKYLSQPRVLPMLAFYPSVNQSQAALDALFTESGGNPDSQGQFLYFAEWSEWMPNVRVPISQPLLLQREIAATERVRVGITLNGTRRIGRWIRGRYISQVSVADDIFSVDGDVPGKLSVDELEERLHYLNFRPVLSAGEPQSFEGLLEYHYFPVRGD